MIWQFYFWAHIQSNTSRDSKDYLHNDVHSSMIRKSQKMGAAQVSIEEWVDKQNTVYEYNGILFNLKREGNSDTYYNMDERWEHYTKWNQTVPRRQILYDPTYMVYLV